MSRAEVLSKKGTEGRVRLTWDTGEPLSDILERSGHVPLPPYIKRVDDAEDRTRYQTVFAKEEGSVAAPTAGLHFTDRVLADLEAKGITRAEVTLHVGLGTFKPVEVDDAKDHTMHRERIEVRREELVRVVEHLSSSTPFLTVVGTTSLRTIESLYWFGVSLLQGADPEHIECEQWAAFTDVDDVPARATAFNAVVDWMDSKGLSTAWGYTSLMLAPGCRISVADALITNFHQPGNTLLLLVAAFVGKDKWKKIYDAALEEKYRLLSYGDSSLLIRTPI